MVMEMWAAELLILACIHWCEEVRLAGSESVLSTCLVGSSSSSLQNCPGITGRQWLLSMTWWSYLTCSPSRSGKLQRWSDIWTPPVVTKMGRSLPCRGKSMSARVCRDRTTSRCARSTSWWCAAFSQPVFYGQARTPVQPVGLPW